MARALDSANSTARSAMASKALVAHPDLPILVHSESASVAAASGGREQHRAGHHVFALSPGRANSPEEIPGVERAFREPTHDIARDAEVTAGGSGLPVSLSNGQAPAAPELSTRAEVPSKSVALTFRNSLGPDSSATEASLASPAHSSRVPIMHLGLQTIRRAGLPGFAVGVGHRVAQSSGIAHRASDPLPPSSTAEPVNSTPIRPLLPDAGSRARQSANMDLTQLANRVYELLVRRLASERQRRGL